MTDVTNRTERDMPQSIAPRRLVPTPRQLRLGLGAPIIDEPDDPAVEDIATAAGSEADEKPRLADAARAYLSGLDPRTIRGSRVPLLVFVVLGLFSAMDAGVYAVILPELRAEFGGSVGPLIVAGTAVSLLNQLVAPVFGYLVDRVKRVRLVQLSNIGTHVIGLGAPLFARSLLGVVMFRSGSGVVAGMQTTAPGSLLPDYYDIDSFTRVVAILPAAGALGGIATPIVAGYSVDHLGGWRPAAIALGIFSIGIACVSLLLREPERAGKQLEALGATKTSVAKPTVTEALRTVRSIRTLRRVWFATIFTGAATYGMSLYLALYWAGVFGLTPTERGYLAALASAVQFIVLVIFAPILGQLAVRKPGRIMTIFGGIVMGSSVFVIIMATSTNLPLSVLASIPLSAGVVALTPAISVIFIRVVPADVRGVGLASLGPFAALGQILFVVVLQTAPSTAGGLRGLAFTFIPFFLLGGYMLASAASGVAKDIRAADAATVARMAATGEGGSGEGTFLVCRDIEVQYQGATVLDGVDLDIEEGEMLALLGTNGAGKSTLLKVICGVVQCSNGAIMFDGRNITQEPPHLNVRHGVVMVPGGRAVFPTLTVRENLRSASLVDSDAGERAMELADVFALFPALESRLDQKAGDLSGGEQQMVALGQALLMRPRLLMIDELSLGLAPAIVDQLLDALQEINRRGTTIVIVEQSVNVALTVAQRAIFMDKGQIRFDGPTEELLDRPDLVRSVFMGGAATGGVSAPRRMQTGVDPATAAIRVEGLAVDFGGIRALDGVSLEVEAREVFGILGPNGAGKTTLFDAISGFVELSAGSVFIEGVDVSGERPDGRARLGLARSFQDARLFPSLTVRENIAVAFERLASHNAAAALVWSSKVRKSEERIRRRVDGLIDLLALGPLADKFVSELSTGSRRAVDVAVVMAAEPKVLLLDEPSSGLAQAEVEALGPVIARLARETGAAVLVIEHDLPLLASVSHRLMAMELGRPLLTGTPDEVLSAPTVLSSYLNASERVLARSGSRMAAITSALGTDHTKNHPTEEGNTP